MARTHTPPRIEGTRRTITVQRCCNGCGRELGDVTREETDAAVSGAPLPDVREECGCPAVVQQLALFTQQHDAYQNGTWPDGLVHPTWEELGEGGQESYLKDALNVVRAMVHLGWAPREDS